MTESSQKFIDALRDELQQYGELLALLEQQQKLVVARAADGVLRTVAAINEQHAVIQVARQEREQRQRALAQELGLDGEAEISSLIQRLAVELRPLVVALVEENNRLLRRVQQRARQNHLLLQYSVQLMQNLLNTFNFVRQPSTYTGAGMVAAAGVMGYSRYNAVG
jgi:flagellar biosynthesis/type III secretory pathway chaperone